MEPRTLASAAEGLDADAATTVAKKARGPTLLVGGRCGRRAPRRPALAATAEIPKEDREPQREHYTHKAGRS